MVFEIRCQGVTFPSINLPEASNEERYVTGSPETIEAFTGGNYVAGYIPSLVEGNSATFEEVTDSSSETLEVPEENKIIEIENIYSENLDLDLNRPIEAETSISGDDWVLKNNELGIVAEGKTYEEALEAFNVYFEFLYETYYLEDDENLGKYAKETKNKIRKLITD